MKILVLANSGMGLYRFRKELLTHLIENENEVYVSLPFDDFVQKLENIGCKFIGTPLERRGVNPLSDLQLLVRYVKLIREITPDVVLTYTIKPNVYGGIACAISQTPYISNVTGLGTSFDGNSILRSVTSVLYKLGLMNAKCVFFQNKSNRDFFTRHKLVGYNRLIPGSGVNLAQFTFEKYPEDDGTIRFLFIGRMMKSKGLDELLQAAKVVRERFFNVSFELIGGIEEDYDSKLLLELDRAGVISYHGQQDDVRSFIRKTHATILPSYHEGTANALLESAATGRPVLASRVPGCIETFDEGVSGFSFEPRCVDSLVAAIRKFIHLPYGGKKEMGFNGRLKMEREFDRNIVIEAYVYEIYHHSLSKQSSRTADNE